MKNKQRKPYGYLSIILVDEGRHLKVLDIRTRSGDNPRIIDLLKGITETHFTICIDVRNGVLDTIDVDGSK